MLILKYHLTEEEFFDFYYYTSWAAPDKKGYRLRYYLRVFLLYGTAAALYIYFRRSSQVQTDLIVFGVIAVIYFLMVPYLIKRSIRKRMRELLEKPENSQILEASEVVLSDTGIIDKNMTSESTFTWEAIVKKAETPQSYYLYTNSLHGIVIPKRVVSSPQDKQELQRLLNTHLPLTAEFPG